VTYAIRSVNSCEGLRVSLDSRPVLARATTKAVSFQLSTPGHVPLLAVPSAPARNSVIRMCARHCRSSETQ